MPLTLPPSIPAQGTSSAVCAQTRWTGAPSAEHPSPAGQKRSCRGEETECWRRGRGVWHLSRTFSCLYVLRDTARHSLPAQAVVSRYAGLESSLPAHVLHVGTAGSNEKCHASLQASSRIAER